MAKRSADDEGRGYCTYTSVDDEGGPCTHRLLMMTRRVLLCSQEC